MTGSLEVPHAAVAVQSDEQAIAQAASFLKAGHVARVQQIKQPLVSTMRRPAWRTGATRRRDRSSERILWSLHVYSLG